MDSDSSKFRVTSYDFFHHFQDLDFFSGWAEGLAPDSCEEPVEFGDGFVAGNAVELGDAAGWGVEFEDAAGLGSAGSSPVMVDSVGTTVG
jgi:hypothetical protein